MSLLLPWLYVFLAALLHECGHLLACWQCGVTVTGVGLSRRGFYIRRAAAAPNVNVWIAAAGPLANLILGALFWGSGFGTINLLLGLMMLLPFRDWDGARVWRRNQ